MSKRIVRTTLLESNIKELHNIFTNLKEYCEDSQELIMEELAFRKLDFSMGTRENRDYIFSLVLKYQEKINKLYDKVEHTFGIEYGDEQGMIETLEDVVEDLMLPYHSK